MRRAAAILLVLVAAAGCKRKAHRPEALSAMGRLYEQPEPAAPRWKPPAEVLAEVQRTVTAEVTVGLADRATIVERAVAAHTGDVPPGFDLDAAVGRLADGALADHRRREATWKGRTDCDRIDAAFAALNRRGIVACADCDVYDDETHDQARRGNREPSGFVSYDAGAVTSAIDENELHFEFGSFADDEDDDAYDKATAAVAAEVVRALRAQKLHVEYDSDMDDDITVKELTWHKRRFSKAPR